jgi:hypothetical protein
LIQKDLGEGLGLHNDPSYFSIFRDHVTGLEYIRNSGELCGNGLFVELGAYKYHVFLNFREVRDNPWNHYAQIANELNGRGAPIIEEALKEMLLRPVQNALNGVLNVNTIHRLMEARISQPQAQLDQKFMEEIEEKMIELLREVKRLSGGREDEMPIGREIRRKLEAILHLPIITSLYPRFQPKGVKAAAEYLNKKLTESLHIWATLFSWLFVHALGKMVNSKDFEPQSRTWIDEWNFGKTIFGVMRDLGLDETTAWKSLNVVKWLTIHQRWSEGKSRDQKQTFAILEALFQDSEVRQFLGVNQYNDIWWFNKEAFEEMLWWLMMAAALTIGSDPLRPVKGLVAELEECYSMIREWQQAGEKSDYQVEKLLSALQE